MRRHFLPSDDSVDDCWSPSQALGQSFDSGCQESPTTFINSIDFLTLSPQDSPPSLPSTTSVSTPPVQTLAAVSTSSIPPPPDITPLLRATQCISKPPPLPAVTNIPTPPDINLLFSSQPFVWPNRDLSSTMTLNAVDSASYGAVKSSRIKKPKQKHLVTKSKVIKFHEYKGPPGAVARAQQSSDEQRRPVAAAAVAGCASIGTPYNIILEQQQLFLQWQLDFQQKNMPIMSSNAVIQQQQQQQQTLKEESPTATVLTSSSTGSRLPFPFTSDALTLATTQHLTTNVMTTKTSDTDASYAVCGGSVETVSATPKPTRLEDLKVADLKAECKRLNLSRSGPKPNLIERLLPHADEILRSAVERLNNGAAVVHDSVSYGKTEPISPSTSSGSLMVESGAGWSGVDTLSEHSCHSMRPPSIVPMDIDLAASQSGSTGGQSLQCTSMVPVMPTVILVRAEQPSQHHRSFSFSGGLTTFGAPPVAAVPLRQPGTVMQMSGMMQHCVVAANNPQNAVRPVVLIHPTLGGTMPQDTTLLRQSPLQHQLSPLQHQLSPLQRQQISLSQNAVNAATTTMPTMISTSSAGQIKREEMRPIAVEASSINESVPHSIMSPEQLLVRQQRHIVELERVLQQSQQERIRAEQEARLYQLQLNSQAMRSAASSDKQSSSGKGPQSQTSTFASASDAGITQKQEQSVELNTAKQLHASHVVQSSTDLSPGSSGTSNTGHFKTSAPTKEQLFQCYQSAANPKYVDCLFYFKLSNQNKIEIFLFSMLNMLIVYMLIYKP